MTKSSNSIDVLNLGISKENVLFLQMLSYLLDKKIGTYSKDAELATPLNFVKLSPELCEHIIALAEKCGDALSEKNIELPNDGWYDVGYDEFRSHIGETIYLSVSDYPWENALEAETIPDNTVLRYPMEMFETTLDCIDDEFLSDSRGDYWLFKDFKDAVELLKANGYSDKDVFKLLKEKMKTLRFLD